MAAPKMDSEGRSLDFSFGEALIARGDCSAWPTWGMKGDINKAAGAAPRFFTWIIN